MVPSLELGGLTALSERFLLVSELVSAISVFTNGSRGWVNAPDTVLLGVAMLAPVSSCAEGLELEVLCCQRK
jgi:hypothetical protein